MSPFGPCYLLLITASVDYWAPGDCYSNGKVDVVCDDMVPYHGFPSQTTPAPYHLKTNATMFGPTDRIKVTLFGTTDFQGFFLQARDTAVENSGFAVGTFTLTDPLQTQLLTCHEQQDSAVSHTSDDKKTEVVVIWNPPADAPQQIQFFVTVVTNYSVFWVKLPGPIISQHGSSPHPQSESTLPSA
ncbi:putative ferric-chelate reductase 1 [Antennarius striatus]|uniref:putative ferric-chelate reductase 1 n=1 Tax=Antennarius striatus TaxID=241820 RepID=UPI0035B1873B